MRKLIVSTLALLAAVQAPLVPAMAQEHGAVIGSPAPAGQNAMLVSILSAGPRTFVTADGETLTLAMFQVPGSRNLMPMLLDSATGRILPLAQTDQEGVLADPAGGRITLSDHANRIDRTEGSATTRAAAAPIRNEAVEFRAGDRTIKGRFTTAAGDGPRPTVILIHGGGLASRDMGYFGLLAGHLAANGVSVLSYDKRGWNEADDVANQRIEDLADDAAAAIRYARSRPDVDAEHLGMVGVSQGGWTAPLAARGVGGVAFLSLISAPATDTWDQEINETIEVLTSLQAGKEDTDLAVAAMRAMYRAAEAGGPTPELAGFDAQLAGKSWRNRIDFDASPANLATLRRTRYDPAGVMHELRTPIQLMFGAQDLVVPVQQSGPIWRAQLAAAGATDVSVDVFAGAGHALLQQTGGGHGGGGPQGAPVLAVGALADLTGWVRARAGLDARSPAPADAMTRDAVTMNADAVSGTYLNANGRIALVRTFGTGMAINDLLTGRFGMLVPDPGNASDFRLYPFDGPQRSSETVRFMRDGRLVTADQFGRFESARIETRLEPVTFRSGDITLGGVVMLPDGPGPFPAVAFVHGSGATSRVAFDAWGRYFAAHGIASIGYDKRGVGQSQGDYRIAGSADFADDLTAAIDVLRARSDIRQDAIGILAVSAGGWPSVEVAQRRNIRFIVTSSMGPLLLAEQERYRRVEIVKAAGHDAATQALAGRVTDAYFRYLGSCGREGAAEISDLYATYGAEPWFKLLPQAPQDPTTGAWPPLRRSFASDLGYQTLEAYAAYPGPMLFLLGGADPLVPTRALSERIAATRRSDWTQFMFDGADHGVAVPARNDTPRVAEGYYDRQIEWIQARLAEPVVWRLHEDRATSPFQHRCEGP